MLSGSEKMEHWAKMGLANLSKLTSITPEIIRETIGFLMISRGMRVNSYLNTFKTRIEI